MVNSVLDRAILFAAETLRPHLSANFRSRLASVLAVGLSHKVKTYRDISARDDVRTWWFDEERTYEFALPEYYNNLPNEIERLIGRHHCMSPFVMEVPAVTLNGDQGLIFDEEGDYLVFDFWREGNHFDAARALAYDFLIAVGHGSVPAWNPSPAKSDTELELAISLLSKHARNYTHWTQDCLTLLEGYEEYIEQTGNKPMILIPPNPPSFIPESLEALGYFSDEYREIEAERLQVSRLVVPSVRRCLSNTSEDYFRMISAIQWVRDRALKNIDLADAEDEYASKILISREDTNTRRIHNREEILSVLSERGFKSYVLSDLPFSEQVRLFSQAETIVGAHGAGMINCIYSTRPQILELYGDHFLPANYELAQGLGAKYGCIECEPVGDDFRVEINDLRSALDELARSN